MQTNLMGNRVREGKSTAPLLRVGAKSEREESRLVRRKVRHTFSVRFGFRLDRVELIVINAIIGIASALNSLHTVLC